MVKLESFFPSKKKFRGRIAVEVLSNNMILITNENCKNLPLSIGDIIVCESLESNFVEIIYVLKILSQHTIYGKCISSVGCFQCTEVDLEFYKSNLFWKRYIV